MLIEDVACPVDKLADMTVDLGEMFQRHGYHEASCFGHALEGNLHLVFSQVSCSNGSWTGGMVERLIQPFLSNCLLLLVWQVRRSHAPDTVVHHEESNCYVQVA
jgi:hypothetical protein